MAEPLTFSPKPDDYVPPSWEDVATLLEEVRKERQPVIERIWEVKLARRGEWQEVIRKIPKPYRQMLIDIDLPMVRDMIQRSVGLIQKQEPVFQVTPPSPRGPDVSKAAKEEARLHAIRLAVEDQQDRPTYAMGIDAQAAWGESWIGIWPDFSRLENEEFERKDDESAEDYKTRYGDLMSRGGIPLVFEDFDPQTVFPRWSSRNRLGFIIIETEHGTSEIELGLGYKAVRDPTGRAKEWTKKTLTEGWVPSSTRSGRSTDTSHDTATSGNGGAPTSSRPVKRVIWADPYTLITYLDGIEVERWEHNFGVIPILPAYGEQTSDRDPAFASMGIADAGLNIAKQLVMFAAIMASNGMQHGFPTPFLKNPAHGLVHPISGEPLTRQVKLGEMNLLGPNEEIEFPYLNAQMMPDFFKHLDWLQTQLESTTVSNFGKAIGSDIAGYAVAQIRAMQLSVLSTVYTNAARQWRKGGYLIRHIVRTCFPGGIFLPGAVEEDEGSGVQYRPILEYAPEHCTDFPVNVHIDEGIPQDEMGMNKMALENLQAGVWSRRRVMEKTGVEDPDAENREIALERRLNSPAADQQVLITALAIVAERFQMTNEQASNNPFMQAVVQAKQKMLGQSGGGAFANQGAEPQNALPGGQPIDQNQPPAAPQQGGPSEGPAPGEGLGQQSFGAMQIPGGVKGVQQVPAVTR